MHRGIDGMISVVTGWANVTEHLNENFLSDTMSTIFTEHPNVQFAFYTRTADAVQLFFLKMMGEMIPNGMSDADALRFWNRHNLVSVVRFASEIMISERVGQLWSQRKNDMYRDRNREIKRDEDDDLHILKSVACMFVCVCRHRWRPCSRSTPTFAPLLRKVMVIVPLPLIAH